MRTPLTLPADMASESPAGIPHSPEVTDERYAVVIADDDVAVRDTLSQLCDRHPNLHVVGATTTGSRSAELCGRYPHLAVVDVVMPQGGVEAVLAILAGSPFTVVAAFTARGGRRASDRLLANGAAAVFVKGADLDLVQALYGLARRAPRVTEVGDDHEDPCKRLQ